MLLKKKLRLYWFGTSRTTPLTSGSDLPHAEVSAIVFEHSLRGKDRRLSRNRVKAKRDARKDRRVKCPA